MTYIFCFECKYCSKNGKCNGMLSEVKEITEPKAPIIIYKCKKYDGKKVMGVVKK